MDDHENPDTSQDSSQDAPQRGSGWSHEYARTRPLVERLLERCAAFAGATCLEREVPHADWCERCLAAQLLTGTRTGNEAHIATEGTDVDDARSWSGHPANLPSCAAVSCLAGGCEWGDPTNARCCLMTADPKADVMSAFRAMLATAQLRARDWQFTATNWRLRAEHSEARERARDAADGASTTS